MTNQPGREVFYCNNILFLIELVQPARNDDGTPHFGQVENENRWRLFRATYHKDTFLRKVKRPRSQQVPRWKSLGYFDSAEAAKGRAKELTEEKVTQ